MIELKNVAKQYLYGERVLGSVNMKFQDGEIIALLGKVAAGKTTLLKVIAGVTDCEGEVLYDGEPLEKKPDDVIMVFDDLALFEHRSCYYNLAYPLKIRGVDKKEIDRRVKECAEKLDIMPMLYDRVKAIPLICKKRLAIARLFLRDCRVVLIDDITRGLKRDEAYELWNQIAPMLSDLAKDGKTVIYATTSRQEAISISDKIAVMLCGKIKQFGSYEQIRKNPSNMWAAEALDSNYYAFEQVTPHREDGKLMLTFRGGYKMDISHLEGRLIENYIGKQVYVGWNSDEFDVYGDRKEEVIFSSFDGEKYTLTTMMMDRVVCKERLKRVGTLPLVDAIKLYDNANENIIIKD